MGKANPTEVLIGELAAELKGASGALCEIEVVEVSVEGVEDFWKRRDERAVMCDVAKTRRPRCAVHFGVYRGSETFRLERCAYNLSNFGRPDVRGVQLEGVPVCDSRPLKRVPEHRSSAGAGKRRTRR